jgi:tetratricopeptide (TPR) repeat protein
VASKNLDTLIADFNDHPSLSLAIFTLGENYYNEAFRYEDEGIEAEAKDHFAKAIAVWERIIQKLPVSAFAVRAYYFSAVSYRRLGACEMAVNYCKKIVANWPDSECASHAQFIISDCYRRLRDSGALPASEANPQIEQAYERLVEKYPDSTSVKYAWPQLELGWLNFERGQWVKAVHYFELSLKNCPENRRPSRILYALGRAYEEMGQLDKAAQVYGEFIRTVDLSDPRIERVKARLEKLGG